MSIHLTKEQARPWLGLILALVILAVVGLCGWAAIAQLQRRAAAIQRREWAAPVTRMTTTTLDPCGPKAMAELTANETLGAADPTDPYYDPQADAALDDYCSAATRNANWSPGDSWEGGDNDPPDPGGP